MTENTRMGGRRNYLVFSGLVIFGLAINLAGCGKATGTVTGKVTFQNTPVKSGTVTFFAEDNVVVIAQIGPDSTYTATVPVGLARVTVATLAKVPVPFDIVKMKVTGKSGNNPEGKSAAANSAPRLPDRYNHPDKSGLRLQVTTGENQYDIPLHAGK